ncbi:HD domain-containing protein [Streptosporangium sp. LJ11]|uniref:HD domain-containing protein n=1 Tax=Streptosporangium sp. LJ11 TaxID=3436927 RepID=UPI003F78B7AF
MQFRSTVEPLANDIAISMPMFTDHSMLHIDSLWDTASLVCGDDYPINPIEAFILGGAFLLHDLGMGLVAYPEGLDCVKRDPQYANIRAMIAIKGDREKTSNSSIQDMLEEQEAAVSVLRLQHAQQAERLVNEIFQVPGGTSFFLLQDSALRQDFGTLIGKIAHSHWWDVDLLGEKFSQRRGSMPQHPAEWTVDPLKIACILRLADAVHIDSRRAPTFLHAFRKPSGISGQHWHFQQRITRPLVVDDRLEYTSTNGFSHNEAAEWWLAFETIKMIDSELRRVDALCADYSRPRFAARSVAGADSPSRFARYIPTQDWHPMDASLRATQVQNLIGNLGGEYLYGNEPKVAVRELIANAADATKARLASFGGSDAVVTVSLRYEEDSWWLTISDNGIGMDAKNLVTSMTDFGRSSWRSESMLEQYPKLLENGFTPAGRFGIGFFSIFMIAEKVHVKSLKYFDSPSNTHVLDFPAGFKERPLLRVAQENERLRIGGTVIEARLKLPPNHRNGLLPESAEEDISEEFTDMLIELCALSEVDIDVVSLASDSPARLVRANDWRYIPLEDLFDRIYKSDMVYYFGTDIERTLRTSFSTVASEVKNADGEVVGRAMIAPNALLGIDDIHRYSVSTSAKVYVGGFASAELNGALGAFQGFPQKADRNSSFPVASPVDIKRWIDEQAGRVIPLLGNHHDRKLWLCATIESFGVSSPNLPCAIADYKAMTRTELKEWAEKQDTITLIPQHHLSQYFRKGGSPKFFSQLSGREVVLPGNAIVFNTHPQWIFPEDVFPTPKGNFAKFPEEIMEISSWWNQTGSYGCSGTTIQAIANAWETSIEQLLRSSISRGFIWFDDESYTPLQYLDGDGYLRVGALFLSRGRLG